MKKTLLLITALFVGVGVANAAVRNADTINRISNNTARTGTARTTKQRTTQSRTTASNTVSRTTTTRGTTSGAHRGTTTAHTVRSATTARAAMANAIARTTAGTPRARIATTQNGARPARATITLNTTQSNTFGTGYNTCRDAYFTCMDQFCGTANGTYRRCICSSKLSEIQSRERALGQASDQLQDFANLNLAVIDKTAGEVNAMISATTGEFTQSISRDTSASAQQLAGISDVLSKAKNKALSTQGTLDIAGDIDAIWATTDLAGGTNIANLTGEALYNAVHAQCSQMVAEKCPDQTTQTMVTSAYGMYIENDCSLLINNLDNKLTAANGTIRATEREMNLARLENYNAHNSTSINDCIAQVRTDITAETACGTDYVHCLDITGRYLNYTTGEPIYSPNFYQLETQISLSGDILTNETNRLLVATLNSKRAYAERGLDTCRDIADSVWDEFMRQAITEIYQGQHERIRQVKNECLDVVNKCYDEQNQQLKDFSNVKEQLLLGSRMELSEQMCQEKLNACSNLYGGGSHGMAELLTAMRDITTQTIGQQCLATLQDYARELCAVPSNDTLHAYPFACRVYTPGEQRYAAISSCNASTAKEPQDPGNINIPSGGNTSSGGSGSSSSVGNNNVHSAYTCTKKYTSCAAGYYMSYNGQYNGTPRAGNLCLPCPAGCECTGGTASAECNDTEEPIIDTTPKACGDDYVGSLYHKMARYAVQACVRPSKADNYALPATVLQDVNIVMDQIKRDMAASLSAECERLGGVWVDTVWVDKVAACTCPTQLKEKKADAGTGTGTGTGTGNKEQATECIITKETNTNYSDGCHDTTGHIMFKKFYSETSANTKWGFCAESDGTSSGSSATVTGGKPNNSGSNSGGQTSGLNCIEGQAYDVILMNGFNYETCCPKDADGAIAISETVTEISGVICNTKPTLPDNFNRPTCTTNPNCKLVFWSNDPNSSSNSAGSYFGPDGTSISFWQGHTTLYSYWGEENNE